MVHKKTLLAIRQLHEACIVITGKAMKSWTDPIDMDNWILTLDLFGQDMELAKDAGKTLFQKAFEDAPYPILERIPAFNQALLEWNEILEGLEKIVHVLPTPLHLQKSIIKLDY
jgi:hypothetical protein